MVSGKESGLSTNTNSFSPQTRIYPRRRKTKGHQAFFCPSIFNSFPAPQGHPRVPMALGHLMLPLKGLLAEEKPATQWSCCSIPLALLGAASCQQFVQDSLMAALNWTLISICCEQGAGVRQQNEPGDSGQGHLRVPITRAVCSDKADLRRSWEAQGQDRLRGQAPAWL